MNSPLKTIKLIGDKLIRDTPFKYNLGIKEPIHVLDHLHCVDFGKTFGLNRPASAYAWTTISSEEDQLMSLELEHNDSCMIWLNDDLIYKHTGDRDIRLRYDERSIEMTFQSKLDLKKGSNSLLIKSETKGQEWTVFLQAPPSKGAVMKESAKQPKIGLHGIEQISAKVADLSNWLLLGPFPRTDEGKDQTDPLVSLSRNQEIPVGRMYPGTDGPVTWTIPKVEALGEMVDPLPWGTNYSWNYHNGGVAWAMQELTGLSGESQYAKYAANFCDFHIEGIPFVKHQVRTLHAVNSANHFIIDTPLLDFTLAPSLPFINRLRKEDNFEKRKDYINWIERMLHYARNEQIRLPGSTIYTRTTPVQYTTWVDDMFMGIPFLVQASLYSCDDAEKTAFLDDAARQTVEFNAQVWDKDAGLYMHARYSGNPVKLPHWARCNGWASWAMSEVLMHLPSTHRDYSAILSQFQTHCDSLLDHQSTDGLWPNVLGVPTSGLEVSGSSIFVMAMARGLRHGWLDEPLFRPAVIRGWEGIVDQIDSDGTVHGICMGTMCSESVDYYSNRPFYDNDTHGLFAVLFAGIEMELLLNPDSQPKRTSTIEVAGVKSAR